MPNVEQNFDPKELNNSQKFVQLLQELQNPEGVKANEIMDKYAIDDRTLRRYITDFATIGIKVEKEGRSEKIVDRAVETSDWRSSLIELEFFIED